MSIHAETYERVLNNGVMVEHAGDNSRGVWGSLTVAGVDVLSVDTRRSRRAG